MEGLSLLARLIRPEEPMLQDEGQTGTEQRLQGARDGLQDRVRAQDDDHQQGHGQALQADEHHLQRGGHGPGRSSA